jgi:hypothetical protein
VEKNTNDDLLPFNLKVSKNKSTESGVRTPSQGNEGRGFDQSPNFKLSRSPRIDSKESIPLAYAD